MVIVLKHSWFYLQFFHNFCEIEHSSKDFLDQNGTHVNGFLVEK